MSCEEETVVDIDLEELINKAIIAKAKTEVRDYSHFHPSEFDKCHRKLVYKYYEYNGLVSYDHNGKSMDPVLQRIFANGHYLHFRLGENLRQTGCLKGVWKCALANHPDHPEQKVYGKDQKLGVHQPEKCVCGCTKFKYQEVGFLDEESMIGGHVDAILDLTGQVVNGEKIPEDAPVEDSHMIVDFKSIFSFGFSKLAGPSPSHNCQMQIYLYLSGLKSGKFLYENKDNQKFRQFLVKRDDDFIADRINEAKFLKRVVTHLNSKGERVIPPRPRSYMEPVVRNNSKECMDCDYRAHCWGLK